MTTDPEQRRVAAIGRMLSQAEELNLFPSAAERIREVADDPDSSVDQLEQAVSVDPTLSAQVMKIANSPFYGMKREVTSLRQALVVLGYAATRDLALALAILSMAQNEDKASQQLWRHSLEVGVGAREIARVVRQVPAGEAFLSGLLHDYGKLVLLAADRVSYLPLVDAQGVADNDLLRQERELFGFDHAELGSACLERWNLPQPACIAVRHHHDLAESRPELVPEQRRMACVTFVANRLVQEMGSDGPRYDRLAAGLIATELGLEAEVLESIAAGVGKACDDLMS